MANPKDLTKMTYSLNFCSIDKPKQMGIYQEGITTPLEHTIDTCKLDSWSFSQTNLLATPLKGMSALLRQYKEANEVQTCLFKGKNQTGEVVMGMKDLLNQSRQT